MIRPITGKLRKRLVLDLSVGLGLGTAGGYAFWYVFFHPSFRKHDMWNLQFWNLNRYGYHLPQR